MLLQINEPYDTRVIYNYIYTRMNYQYRYNHQCVKLYRT